MSEYQYYEFQAVDRLLNQEQMAELRGLSTRAEITPSRFVNVYNFGSFKGDPATLMERYFDVFVYVANWGTHEFMLRLPRRLVDPEAMKPYGEGRSVKVRFVGDFAIHEQWIAGLAESEKNALLLDLMEGAGLHLGAELRQRFRRTVAPTNQQVGDATRRRTVGQLLKTAEERTETRRQAEAERIARESAKRQAEQAATRAKHLDRLAMNELEAWRRVEALIDTKRPPEYDQAVTLLVDLRDMSARTGRTGAYTERLHDLRGLHARKPSLMERFDRAKL